MYKIFSSTWSEVYPLEPVLVKDNNWQQVERNDKEHQDAHMYIIIYNKLHNHII